MTAYLPLQLLKLFLPRPPLKYLPPLDDEPRSEKVYAMGGLAATVSQIKDGNIDQKHRLAAAKKVKADPKKGDRMDVDSVQKGEGKTTNNHLNKIKTPCKMKYKSKKEMVAVMRRMRRTLERVRVEAKRWNAKNDKKVQSDPFLTLIVYNLSYETSERTLYRAFEDFGKVKSLRIVEDKDKKSKGYGFVEYFSEQDMKIAFKRGHGMRIDGRRVKVDVERGRTVKNWKPRRLGGGLGGRTIRSSS